MDFRKAEFIKSAASDKDFIRDGKPQIVFAGRSNVGKSSVLNCIMQRKNFARVGATPGKTVHINYFLIDKRIYLVDLPGYGYAAVSKAERDRWGRLMESYFSFPELISAGVLIIDSRHKPTVDDITMSDWFKKSGCRLIVAANKTDKVKKSELESNIKLIGETLSLSENEVLIPFSAEKAYNRDLLISELNHTVEQD